MESNAYNTTSVVWFISKLFILTVLFSESKTYSSTSVAQFFQSVFSNESKRLTNSIIIIWKILLSLSECLHNNIKLSLLTVMGYFINRWKDYIQYIRENMQVLKLIRIKMNWKLVNSKLIGIWELIPSPIYSFTKTSRLCDIFLSSIFSQEENNFVSKDVCGNDSLTNQAENDDTHLLWCLPKPRTIWNAEGMKARSQSTATGASPGLCICLPAMSLSKPPGLTNDWISLQKPCKH